MFNFFSLKPMLETLETSMFKSKSCSCSVKIQSTYHPSFFTHLYSLSKKHIYVYVYVSDMCIIHTLCVYILKDLKGSSFFAYSFNKKKRKIPWSPGHHHPTDQHGASVKVLTTRKKRLSTVLGDTEATPTDAEASKDFSISVTKMDKTCQLSGVELRDVSLRSPKVGYFLLFF